MRKRLLVLLAAVLVAGGAGYYFFILNGKNDPDADILVSGNIEVTTVDLAFKIPGKIERLLVDEGDPVKQGQTIALLEHKDLLTQKAKAESTLEVARTRIPSLLKNIELQDRATLQDVAQSRAAVDAARARLRQLEVGSRPQEIQQAKAGLEQAKSDLVKRRADMERAEKLFKSNYISAQDWDAAKNAHDVAAATHRRAEEVYALVVEGPRVEEIDAARAQLEQTRAAFNMAEARRIQLDVLRRDLETARAQVNEASASIE
ncbi:MAG TPA: biotin/lipoyl-binding protein, partial [Thermodesulfobacteriota bacterium]|nr:biotin/lipoyl-binding protein [Thermodesulfobacteriota bacterium]